MVWVHPIEHIADDNSNYFFTALDHATVAVITGLLCFEC
jgi:hypothetical protein